MSIIVAQTPDGKWTNWSIARIMLVDERRMAGIVAPTQHIGMVRKQWSDLGKDMPFALAMGTEPFIPFVGGMPLPAYVNEADFAGAYFGEPAEESRKSAAFDDPTPHRRWSRVNSRDRVQMPMRPSVLRTWETWLPA